MNVSACIIYNKYIIYNTNGKCFVRYLRTRCFCIRNLTRSLRSLVRFLTRQQLVRKYRTPVLSMKYSLCIIYKQYLKTLPFLFFRFLTGCKWCNYNNLFKIKNYLYFYVFKYVTRSQLNNYLFRNFHSDRVFTEFFDTACLNFRVAVPLGYTDTWLHFSQPLTHSH